MPESPSCRMLACRSRPLTRRTSGRRCLGADGHRPLTEHMRKERNPGDSNLANWEAKHLLARNLCSLSANSVRTFFKYFFWCAPFGYLYFWFFFFKCNSLRYRLHPSGIRCWGSNPRPLGHEPSALTTRPGFSPFLDGLSCVARSPILHQDDILVVGEVDPGEHVRMQDQFQVVFSPHSEARFEEDWQHFYPVRSDKAKHPYLLWLLKGFHFWRSILSFLVGDEPVCSAVDDLVDIEVLLIREQDDRQLFLKIGKDFLASFKPSDDLLGEIFVSWQMIWHSACTWKLFWCWPQTRSAL